MAERKYLDLVASPVDRCSRPTGSGKTNQPKIQTWLAFVLIACNLIQLSPRLPLRLVGMLEAASFKVPALLVESENSRCFLHTLLVLVILLIGVDVPGTLMNVPQVPQGRSILNRQPSCW